MKKAQEFHGIIIDTTILLLLIFITTFICCYTDKANELYDLVQNNQEKKYLEVLCIVAFSSFYLIIFILRRFFELKAVIKKANTDVLVNIANRRCGMDLMQNVMKKGENASLIMFDIDDFKKINDIYGHNTGDSVLQKIVHLAKEFGRKQDELIRWGGDEFIILCYKTSQKEAFVLAQRLQKKIEGYCFEKKFFLTASFGVIKVDASQDLRAQIDILDRKMYKSKKTGKNRVYM